MIKLIKDKPLEYSDITEVSKTLGKIATVFINPKDFRDVYSWEVSVTGPTHSAKREFSEISFVRNEDVPKGVIICMTKDGQVDSIVKEHQ